MLHKWVGHQMLRKLKVPHIYIKQFLLYTLPYLVPKDSFETIFVDHLGFLFLLNGCGDTKPCISLDILYLSRSIEVLRESNHIGYHF